MSAHASSVLSSKNLAMAPPPSPSSGGGGGGSSSRLLVHSNSSCSEWKVMQKKIRSSLLLLLGLSTFFLCSVLYFAHSSFSAAVATEEALAQSPGLAAAAVGMGRLVVPDQEVAGDQKPEADADASLITSVNYSASEVVARSSSATGISLPSAATASSAQENNSAGLIGEIGVGEEERCDISMGRWVEEPRGPVYTNMTCPMLPDFKNCQKYGKEPGYLYWRWQPDGCDLPRLSPERFLDVVRGKRLAFIGDSLARNQMDSLLCLLSQAETPTDVYRDAFDRFRTWHFPAHDFTLMAMWTEFYVQGFPVVANGTPTASFDLHLDRLNTNWTSRLPELDVAVLSGGNWFFRVNYLWEAGARVGCVNCREPDVADFGIPYAVRRVVRKALEAVTQCRDCKKSLVTFVRTYTPAHFEHGSWFDGGYCNRTRPLDEAELRLGAGSIEWELRRVQREEARRAREAGGEGGERVGVLDVTKAMMLRVDGHPGAHYDKRWVRNANDCLHWCLPGPVDMWNDLLLQRLAELSPAR